MGRLRRPHASGRSFAEASLALLLLGAGPCASAPTHSTDLSPVLAVSTGVLSGLLGIVLVVYILIGCVKKKNPPNAAMNTDSNDHPNVDIPLQPNASYKPSEDSEIVVYDQADDQPNARRMSLPSQVMYADLGPEPDVNKVQDELPQYAVVQHRQSQAINDEVYNVAMSRDRPSTRSRHASSESRDIYGNAELIFKSVVVDKDQIHLDSVIDAGQFGEVMAGVWSTSDGRKIPIAAKTIKGTVSATGKKAFIDEATMMSQLVHKNVLGVLAVTEDPLMLIMERVSERSLKAYIEQHGYSHVSPMPFPTLVEFAKQTAQGMSYLAEHGIVHRDIAARNMLLNVVSRTNFSCKVADFGLSKVTDSIFLSKTTESKVPIPTRWTALEALYKGQWSQGSDVWSWAVMIWELTTHGQFPYTLIWEDKPTVDLVAKGLRLHQAELLPDELFHMLMKCWATKAERRLTFRKIAEQLSDISMRMLKHIPDPSSFDVIDRKLIEAALSKEANSSKRKGPAPAMMFFYLPTGPTFVEAPSNVDISAVYYKIMPPEEEDPVFIRATSQFADAVVEGHTYERVVKQDRRGKVETLKIGKDDLLPPAVHFVRQRGSTEQNVLYAPPKLAKRQSVAIEKLTTDPNQVPVLPGRSYDRNKLLSGKAKSREPHTKYSQSAGNRVQELMGFTALAAESTDSEPTHMNQDSSETSDPVLTKSGAAFTSTGAGGYENTVVNRYENYQNDAAISTEDKKNIEKWLAKGHVVREDAEDALQGMAAGSFVVRRKGLDAVDFVITMYLGREINQFKHYRLLATGPSGDFSVDMIDTVNGNMTFQNLWELIVYYQSHVPGVKRALPIKLGRAASPK